MKNHLMIFVIVFVFIQCKDKGETPTPIAPSNPAPITVEEPSHSCTIITNSGTKEHKSAEYQITYTSGLGRTIFTMTLMLEGQSGMNFTFDSDPQVKKYSSEKMVNFVDGNKSVYEPLDGEIEVLKFDKRKSVISGKFNFSATNKANGDTLKISEGRFDNLKFKKLSAGL